MARRLRYLLRPHTGQAYTNNDSGDIMTSTPAAHAQAMLDQLNAALARRDTQAAAELFADECYWRDLVLLTWNLKTLEGRAAIRQMLDAQLDAASPVVFSLSPGETVDEADGVVSAWIDIDTRLIAGHGHIRIQDGRIWTLLTTAQELKGHEEPLNTRRPMGAEHGIQRGRKTWLERREEEAAELGRSQQPFVLVIGGGQGGIALGARLRQLGVSHIVIDRYPAPATSGAAATSRCACTTRCGTTTCPTCPSRRTGRCSRPRTRSATGWRCTPRSWKSITGLPPIA